MKVLKLLLSSATLLCVALSSLSASPYVARVNPGYSPFGFSSFGSYPTSTLPAASTPSTTTTPSTLQTSSCLYNSCGGNVPGTTTTVTPSLASSFTSSPSSNYNYGYSGFRGGVMRYSVFGMYNFRAGAFGATQQPVLSGGLTSTNVLGDPLANPEPTTVALFGTGLFVLGWAQRRRLSRKA